MASEKVSSLLLSQPLPLSAITLGRLVRDPLFPDMDFYDPAIGTKLGPEAKVLPHTDTVAGDGSQQSNPFTPNVVEHRFENFKDTIDAARGTGLELNLMKVLSLVPLASYRSSSTTLNSRLCVVHQLRNPNDYFHAACGEVGVRAWLEEESSRPDRRQKVRVNRVYLVCGFKILTDALVSHSSTGSAGIEAAANVPAAVVAAAAGAGPLPIPGDIGAAVRIGASSAEDLAYTVPGERVFAVQYRRIRFARFSTRSVDSAYLEKTNRWKSFIVSRAEDDEEEDGIAAEVAGVPDTNELEGNFENVDIDGETFLYAQSGAEG